MSNANERFEQFQLEIPLDASNIEDFRPEQDVKIVAQDRKGAFYSQTVKLDERGQGVATLTFPENPGSLHVMVGPADAADEEMVGIQHTIAFDLATGQWRPGEVVTLAPIAITAFYWHWWLRWCRTFVIRGRVLCPDGSPVPGAKVCAYDVDSWWWWCSKQLVGCDTTDATGAFALKFRWCCGWWPWWWWKYRVWRLEPMVVDQLLPVLQRELKLRRLPTPSPQPDLALFDELFEQGDLIPRAARAAIDPAVLERLGAQLKERLPVVPQLEPLHLWPWWPWRPWWDCTPDIIFQVTQNCGGNEVVIVNESCWDTRWNIPTTLDVTLVANNEACCVDTTPQPEGNCTNLTHVCQYPISTIGDSTSPLAGFQNPGAVSNYGDRPFAGTLSMRGDFGTLAGADYYELEWTQTPADPASWAPMPPGTVAGFNRLYFGRQLPAGPVSTYSVPFNVTLIDGRNVIESRKHFEANNGAGTWEVLGHPAAPEGRWWMNNKDLLVFWVTNAVDWADGTYHLRVKSWTRPGYVGNLSNPQILARCGAEPEEANSLVLTLDNRLLDSGVVTDHPTAGDHPCGPGTVHNCTREPDTDILAVTIVHDDSSETPVGACGITRVTPTDWLQVDFVAHDPDGHLAFYTLAATYGENQSTNLLSLPGATLTPSPLVPPASPVAAATQVGPTYAAARSALPPPQGGAAAPIWHGGSIRLRVPATGPAGTAAFPVTCCYQLELRAHKRTIVSCDTSLWGHINYSEYSFMVEV
jgi:hypothetical protein